MIEGEREGGSNGGNADMNGILYSKIGGEVKMENHKDLPQEGWGVDLEDMDRS